MAVEIPAGKKAWMLIMGTTENPSEGSFLRTLLLLILLAGIGISGYVIYKDTGYVAPQIEEVRKQVPTADIKRLGDMVKNLNAANAARVNSLEVARITASMARYPFVAERAVTESLIIDPAYKQVVIIPPSVRIRGTLILGGSSAAVLDIEGEPKGKIYKVGDRFADKKGRIVRIVPGKVTIVYENKEFTYNT